MSGRVDDERNHFVGGPRDPGMSADVDLDSLSFVQRITLLGIADAANQGDDPVDSREVKELCRDHLDRVDAAVVSDPAERDVMRALSALGSKPYVTERQPERSPTGKGRPMYGLAVDPDSVLDVLAGDDRLDPAVSAVRE